mgnify:CR=1 FL=1
MKLRGERHGLGNWALFRTGTALTIGNPGSSRPLRLLQLRQLFAEARQDRNCPPGLRAAHSRRDLPTLAATILPLSSSRTECISNSTQPRDTQSLATFSTSATSSPIRRATLSSMRQEPGSVAAVSAATARQKARACASLGRLAGMVSQRRQRHSVSRLGWGAAVRQGREICPLDGAAGPAAPSPARYRRQKVSGSRLLGLQVCPPGERGPGWSFGHWLSVLAGLRQPSQNGPQGAAE